MARKLDHALKEEVIEALKFHGTKQYASKICNVSVKTITAEMNRSEVFKRRVIEAMVEGKSNIADRAIELIKSYAFGENTEKTDRNRLTAAMALANAYEPGFRGTTNVQGRIEHDVKVISAVPRPKYQITEPEKKKLDKPKEEVYNSVEDVIEGEVIND